jgi:hypothetical protein
MANWKKVLVSGSQIQVAGITASNIPSSGGVDDRVVVFNSADGEFKSVTQGSIQGITVASFGITGSDASGDTFNATTDILTFAGDITASVAATADATGSTLTLNLPQSILSSSAQIASNISGAFDSASTAVSTSLGTLIVSNTTNISTNTTNIGTLSSATSSYVNNSATSSFVNNSATSSFVFNSSTGSFVLESETGSFAIAADISGAFDADSASIATDIATNVDHISDLTGATGSYITNIAGTANEITVTSGSAGAQVVISQPTDVVIGNDLTVNNNLTVLGIETIEGQASIVSGAFQAGSGSTIPAIDLLGGHQFTGSVNISGALNVNGVATITDLPNENSVGPTNIVVHDANGKLFSAGANVTASISGAFNAASASLATNIATNTTNIATNTDHIGDLTLVTSSYVNNSATSSFVQNSSTSSFAIAADISGAFDADSASLANLVHNNLVFINDGIHFDTAADGGFSRALQTTASFAATNNATAGGFSVKSTSNTITYEIADTFFSGSGIVSSSAQISIGDVAGSPATHSFTRFAVSGQDNVDADSNSDTLTLIGGTNISIVTTASTDTIQINATDEDVTVTNLETRLGQIDTSVTIGNATSVNTTIAGDLNVNENLTVTKDLIVLGETVQTNVTNVFVEDQFILLNSGALGTGNDNDKDGGLVVDTGGGIGTALIYDFDKKAWGFKGADGTADDLVSGSVISKVGEPITPNLYIATVSQSNLNPFDSNGGATSAGSSSLTPKFGTATAGATAGTNLGSMHVNSNSGEIWIYS